MAEDTTRALPRGALFAAVLASVSIGLLALAAPAAAAGGKLSESDYKAVQQQLAEALKARDDWKMGAAIAKLGEDQSKRAATLLGKVLAKTKYEDQTADAAATAFAAIAGNDDEGRDEVKRMARKDRSWKTRLLCVDAIAKTARDEADWAILYEAIAKDKQDEVRIAAAQACGRSRRDEAIDPLIESMTALDKKKGPVWETLKAELARLVGASMDAGIDYRNYWDGVKANPDRKPPEPSEGGTVTLFGREINCTHPVFVLDISGSMNSIDPEAASGMSTVPGSEPLDPTNSRIERAKRELVKVLEGLPSSTKFNIVSYSTDVQFWQPEGLHALNSSNKKKAIDWVNKLAASGVTVTDRALVRTFDQIKDARCIYLLSDGFATHDGKTPVPTEEILSQVRDKNRFRRVHVNTLGFPQADVEMMQALAKETGGTYSDIK